MNNHKKHTKMRVPKRTIVVTKNIGTNNKLEYRKPFRKPNNTVDKGTIEPVRTLTPQELKEQYGNH